MSLRDSAIIGAASLINLHDILSKPFAFLVDVDVRIFKTSSGERVKEREIHFIFLFSVFGFFVKSISGRFIVKSSIS